MTGPVAYLTGEYPKVSHTFIQREIEALRAGGIDIRSCTIRRPAPQEVTSDQRQEEVGTYCVLEEARRPLRLLGAHLHVFRRSPRRWFSALRLAYRTMPPGPRAWLWQAFYFAEAAVLARHLERIGARHLHNHFATSSCSVAMLTSEMSGLPYSFTLHGPTELFAPDYWRLDEKIARACFSVFISHFARSQGMLFSDRKHWDRMRIVHCGIDPDLYGSARQAAEGKHILFIGRLTAVKGAVLLLEAAARLAERHPEMTLTLVGDGPDRAMLEARASELGLIGRVTFTGYLGQGGVAARLGAADLLALPSFAEGVPVVLMEAMASRLPVIASRIAGIQELVEDGVSGFTVPPGDMESLIDRLDRLLSDPKLRAQMGAKGRAKVAAEYAVKHEVIWLAKLFQGSMAGWPPEGLRPAEKSDAA